MQKQILIHIGAPKCGSTYLQNVFLKNREMLDEARIIYREPLGSHPGNGLLLKDMTSRSLSEMSERADTLIFSHEDLMAGAGRLKEGLTAVTNGPFKPRIVLFLRPFREIIYGDYSQFMKQFCMSYLKAGTAYDGLSFDEFAKSRHAVLNVIGFLRAWKEHVPDASIDIHSHREIRAAMSACLGSIAERMEWSVPTDKTNPSLRVADCEALARYINRGGGTAVELKSRLAEALTHANAPDPGRTETRDCMIDEIFADQTAALERDFGFRLRGARPMLDEFEVI